MVSRARSRTCRQASLGDTASRLASTLEDYSRLKADMQALFGAFPAYAPESYAALVNSIAAEPRDALVSITRVQLSMIMRAAISQAGRNLGLAAVIYSNPRTTKHRRMADSLLASAATVLLCARRVVEGLEWGERLTSPASRAVGLGAIPVGVAIAAIVAWAGIIVVSVFLLYALVSAVQNAVQSYAAANRACELDAEAGHPCSGEAWTRYRGEAAEQARRDGVVPSVDAAVRQVGSGIGSAIFWGTLVAVAGALAYTAVSASPFVARAQEATGEGWLPARARAAGSLAGSAAARTPRLERVRASIATAHPALQER